MKTYDYYLDKEGFKKLKNDLRFIQRSITTKKFKRFIADKCLDELVKIQQQSLSSINSDDDIILSDYMASNHVIISGEDDDTITIYNNATIDVSTKEMSEEKKANYEGMTLSLAKVVEYGVGFIGLVETPHKEEIEDWKYDVNNYFQKGWVYKTSSGEFRRTAGFAGRMIFYQLKMKVEEKIFDWISEYWVEEATKSL